MCAIGYGASQKGCHVYDIEHMKVNHSTDVVFNETFMPGIQKESAVKNLMWNLKLMRNEVLGLVHMKHSAVYPICQLQKDSWVKS